MTNYLPWFTQQRVSQTTTGKSKYLCCEGKLLQLIEMYQGNKRMIIHIAYRLYKKTLHLRHATGVVQRIVVKSWCYIVCRDIVVATLRFQQVTYDT